MPTMLGFKRFLGASLLLTGAAGPSVLQATSPGGGAQQSQPTGSDQSAAIGSNGQVKTITVSGALTYVGDAGPVTLVPKSGGQAFDIQVSAIGTVYSVVLVDAAGADTRQWHLEMSRAPVFGNQNWAVSLSAAGAEKLSCGGMTMSITPSPAFVPCSAAAADLAVDRKALALEIGQTQLMASSGRGTATIEGTLNIAFPAPLRIARLEDYQSRSSGTVTIDGVGAGISSGTPHPASNGGSSKMEFTLEAPALANGLTIDPQTLKLTLADQAVPGQSATYSCGRVLTDAERACLQAPITLGRRCDTSFLQEAKTCKSISFRDSEGGLQASFDETLFDDVTSRTVKSVHVSASVASGPMMRGRISSADGRYAFSCDKPCNVVRTISATADDITETIIISDVPQHALGIRRSLLYPDRITVTLDMVYTGSIQPQLGYGPITPNMVRFNDDTSEISFDSLRLLGSGGAGSVVLSGSVHAFAR